MLPLFKLLAVLLVWLLIGYCYELYRGWRLEPTGDALFDRYARAVRNRYSLWLYYSPPGSWKGAPYVPDEVLAKWEPQFGSDPRYWQLRYFSALPFDPPGFGGGPYTSIPRGDVSMLEQAVQRGIADETVWMLLHDCRVDGWREQRDKAESVNKDPQPALARGEAIESPEDADHRCAREERDFLAQMKKALPESPWPYYLAAVDAVKAGENDQAESDLAQGNSLNTSVWPYSPFPVSFVEERLKSGKASGNKSVASCIYGRAQAFLPGMPLVHKHFRQYVEAAAKSGDSSALKELHGYVCRCALLNRSYMTMSIMRSTVRKSAREVLLNWPSELDKSTVKDMLRVWDLALLTAETAEQSERAITDNLRWAYRNVNWLNPVGQASPAHGSELAFDAFAENEMTLAGLSEQLKELQALAAAYPAPAQ